MTSKVKESTGKILNGLIKGLVITPNPEIWNGRAIKNEDCVTVTFISVGTNEQLKLKLGKNHGNVKGIC